MIRQYADVFERKLFSASISILRSTVEVFALSFWREQSIQINRARNLYISPSLNMDKRLRARSSISENLHSFDKTL